MTQRVVLDFFPNTVGGILRNHAPSLFQYLMPAWVAERCPIPSTKLQIPGGDAVTLNWPVAAGVILSGLVLSWVLGTRSLVRVVREGAKARQGMFIWSCALLWYGVMCLGGLFFHCFHVRPVFHMLDVAGTGLSSLCVIAGFTAFGGKLDDRTVMQRLNLLLSSLAVIAVVILAPPVLQEQFYILPSSAAAVVGARFFFKSLARTHRAAMSSAQLAGHRKAQGWLGLGGFSVLFGLSSIVLDQYACLYLGAHFSLLFGFFLACNLAILSAFQFALVVAEKNLHFTDAKRE